MNHSNTIRAQCAIQNDDSVLAQQVLIAHDMMRDYGTRGAVADKLGSGYVDMLSIEDFESGDLKPAFLAIADNYDLYHKIVEFYRQDFICFGFEHNWIEFRKKIYAKYNTTMENKRRRKWQGIKSEIDKNIKNVTAKYEPTMRPKPTKRPKVRPSPRLVAEIETTEM